MASTIFHALWAVPDDVVLVAPSEAYECLATMERLEDFIAAHASFYHNITPGEGCAPTIPSAERLRNQLSHRLRDLRLPGVQDKQRTVRHLQTLRLSLEHVAHCFDYAAQGIEEALTEAKMLPGEESIAFFRHHFRKRPWFGNLPFMMLAGIVWKDHRRGMHRHARRAEMPPPPVIAMMLKAIRQNQEWRAFDAHDTWALCRAYGCLNDWERARQNRDNEMKLFQPLWGTEPDGAGGSEDNQGESTELGAASSVLELLNDRIAQDLTLREAALATATLRGLGECAEVGRMSWLGVVQCGDLPMTGEQARDMWRKAIGPKVARLLIEALTGRTDNPVDRDTRRRIGKMLRLPANV